MTAIDRNDRWLASLAGQSLSFLERDMLRMLADGLTEDQISRRLDPEYGASARGVRHRVRVMRAKLGAQNMANLIHLGHTKGYLK